MAFDLLAIGETMLALAPRAGESLRRAPALVVDHAGAESNTCVGLARLGLRVAWVSRLGDDAAGERILDALSAEGIDTRWVRRDAARRTGLMLKDPDAPGRGVCYYRAGSAASVLSEADLDGVPIADARAVLVTGVTALIGPQPHAAAVALLSSARGLRIVDPNLRAGLWGSDRRVALVRPLVERCSLLLSGAAELAELLDAGDHTDLASLATQARAVGPPEVVIRGERSVGVLGPDGTWRTLDITRGDAVDPIGAGDAFNAGYIAVRLRDGSTADALAAGARCGRAVTATRSDTAAFPRTLK